MPAKKVAAAVKAATDPSPPAAEGPGADFLAALDAEPVLAQAVNESQVQGAQASERKYHACAMTSAVTIPLSRTRMRL
jgi:hypothetical protein